MKIAIAYINGFPIVGRTKIPPCGARSVQLNAIDNPPAVAEPIIQEGITLNGSFALNLQDNQSSPLLTAYRLAVQYCFCIGGIGVKIEFVESGPSLQDTLTDFLLRQKSGL